MASFSVINRSALIDFLYEEARFHELPPALVYQSLERALLREEACLEKLVRYPRDRPVWLTREIFENGTFYRFSRYKALHDAALCNRIGMVITWLRECCQRAEPWLDDRDERGRIQRLMTVGTLQHIQAMARKDTARWEAKRVEPYSRRDARNRIAECGTIAEVLTLAEGWRWVELKDAESFTQDGALMRHCLDAEMFDGYRRRGARALSLRDPKNRPRVTLEVSDEEIVQSRGRANTRPKERYLEAIEAVRKAIGLRWRFELRTGPRFERAGNLYCDIGLTGLPIRIPGSLVVREEAALYGGIGRHAVAGDLIVIGQDALVEMHLRVRTDGNLIIRNCPRFEAMRAPLWIKGNVLISGCSGLRNITGPITIEGTCEIVGAVNLAAMAGTLRVQGDLSLRGALKLERLPEILEVGGDLDIRMTAIKKWPKDLHLGGAVIVESEKQARRVPRGIRVRIEPS
jgi:hypothetical protein